MSNTPPQPPPEQDTLADHIRRISDGFQRLTRSGINRYAVVVLLKEATRLSKRDIEAVLGSLKDLERTYCK